MEQTKSFTKQRERERERENDDPTKYYSIYIRILSLLNTTLKNKYTNDKQIDYGVRNNPSLPLNIELTQAGYPFMVENRLTNLSVK